MSLGDFSFDLGKQNLEHAGKLNTPFRILAVLCSGDWNLLGATVSHKINRLEQTLFRGT